MDSKNLLQKFSSVFEDTLVKIKDDKKYVIDSDSSDFLLLTYFLNYGNLPWWADKNQIDLINIENRKMKELKDLLLSKLATIEN